MKLYKYTKLLKLGPVDGFLIHTTDDRKLKDTHPQTIVRELNRMSDRIKRLEEAGNELRECASRIGTVASGEGSVIRRTQEAIQAWDKEAKL
jgi:hypothetical protein